MAAKKSASRKSMKKPVMKKVMPVVKEPLTKSGLVKALMGMTGLSKRDVVAVNEAMGSLIELHIKPRGPGKFTLPGFYRILVVQKAARPARKGINPFTGEEVMFKAKPAHKVVKIKALKRLKEVAA